MLMRNENPVGAWRRIRHSMMLGVDALQCPNCSAEFAVDDMAGMGMDPEDWRFCPVCGARVEGVGKNDG